MKIVQYILVLYWVLTLTLLFQPTNRHVVVVRFASVDFQARGAPRVVVAVEGVLSIEVTKGELIIWHRS